MRIILKYMPVLLVVELIACLVIFAPVQAAAITISLNPTTGTVGTTVTISGTSPGTADSIGVSFDSMSLTITTATANAWSTTIVIPAAVAGNHTITATDITTPETAPATFTVVPKIILIPTTGTTGNSVTITGSGFATNSTVQIKFNGTSIGVTGGTDPLGNLLTGTSFVVPAAATGTYTVAVTDTNSNTASASFTNTVTPTISLTKASGTVGISVIVSGVGFAANEQGIQVTLNGSQVGSTTTALNTGAWNITFTVPAMPAGSYMIGAFGNNTLASSIAAQSFSVIASFALGKTSGPLGTAITANGSGFAANEPNIILTWDNSTIGSPVTAGANGSWTASFSVPIAASGAHSVAASGPTTTSVTAIPFTITPNILNNRTNGIVGTSVSVAGSGFAASEGGITVTFDGTAVGASTTADANGSWTSTFTVPVSAGGPHTVSAKGATTTAASVPTMTFMTLPTISTNKATGTEGASITVSGSGFAANENNITITYDDNPVSSGITADATGSWSATFIVPASSAGTHTIKAKGSVTPLISAGNTNFQMAPNISVNPTIGFVGSSVTVTGSGFASDSALSFYYDGTLINNVQAETNDSGNVSISITIPVSKAGNHTIKVSDANNNNFSTTFSVDNTPPPIPNPTSPADGSRIGLTGNATPTFKWSAVVDPNYASGVVYNIQIDTDSAFPHPLLLETGLIVTHYTLTKVEALPRGQYYWRVQAVDPASNKSAWSQSVMLNSGMISSGLLIFLIVLVIVIIIAVLYFLLVRPAMKKRRVPAIPAAAASAPTPEIVIPDMVNAEFRTVDTEDPTKRRALPWRLALPQATQPPKGAKTFSPEDQARLKVVIDFAKALPLMECGNNTDWLIELAENDGGNTPSPALYAQLLKGEIQVRYEPAWIRHPTYNDLQDLLEGQSVLQDLNSFIDSVNRTASEAVQLLQSIYKDTNSDTTGDILDNSGWGFISGVYSDSIGWFLGKYLRELSDRDYTTKQEGATGEGTSKFGLYGAQNTPFEGLLVQTPGEKEAAQMRVLHLKLRRIYRNSDKSKQMASLLTQLDVQRNRLVNAFSQFSRLNP